LSQVFVSYSSKDRPVIAQMVKALTDAGVSVWWDRQIPKDGSFALVIDDKVDEARHVLVAWSVNSCRSLYVRGEALRALDQGKLLQTVLDDSRLPIPFNAMEATFFSGIDEFRRPEDWPRLLHAIDPEKFPHSGASVASPAPKIRESDIIRAGASRTQLASVWVLPVLVVLLAIAGVALQWPGVQLPAGLPSKDYIFLGVGVSILALFMLFLLSLVRSMIGLLQEKDPRTQGGG